VTGQLNLPLRLADSASFENFFPAANGEALAAVSAITDSSARPRSLYLYGSPASGKSHLLHALCRGATEQSQLTVFVPAGLESIEPELVSQLNPSSIVCVDDLENIAGTRVWEEALLELYERVQGSTGALVVAGRRPPGEAGLLLPDLATRLAVGGVYSLHPLAEADMADAMRLRAHRRGLELSDAVISYLLRRVRRDSATVFAMLDHLDAQAFSQQRRLTVPFVREVAAELLGD
jgi:DnaA family protein|tara:strand:+ start:1609 stop:2313 length:705 start_codon:yes stop_codon:yes gene_type:complete